MIKKYLENLYVKAVNLNHKNISDLLERNENAEFIDLGCDDGVLSLEMANKIGTNNICGVEIVPERIRLSQEKGILVKNFDLNENFDFEDGFFDIIHANQVIEHLNNSDNFISEIYRILKPGGYAIISTENASSWCNIFASIMGWQIFSLTNFSNKKQGIGNPFALHRGGGASLSSWNHVRIYNIRGLKEYLEAFGFKIEEIKGAGYFPLPALFGNLDKTHCHFMTFKIKK
ncbi:MAG: class I SAM-dependent methyltransferase [Parcubacteria group bacterium]|jgi:SAM-dependent methyltransferase